MRQAGSRPGTRGLGPETTFDVVVDNRVAYHGAWCFADPAPDLLNIENLTTFARLRSGAPIRACPTALQGPLGRLRWVISEVIGIVRGDGPDRDPRPLGDGETS